MQKNNNKIPTRTLSKIALSLSALFSFSAFSADYQDVTHLPVLTDDCGVTSCADRRGYTFEQVNAIFADAQNASSNGKSNAKSSNKNSTKGQGLGGSKDRVGTQVVYLNFEQSSPVFDAVVNGLETFNSHIYTQQERDEIQRRIAADYEGFDLEFTQTQPASGDFSTLNFECQNDGNPCVNFSGGILFGRAQSIDIGNEIRDDSAFVDASLWEILVQLDPSGNFFSSISGIPVVDGDVQAALSTAIVNQASNTGTHELGHNLGLRHHDSFGSPGTGLPTTGVPSNDAFFPVFDGPRNGAEAILHTMASGASVGSGFTDSTVRDRFFSERSVIKLAANQRARLVSEDAVSGGNKKVHLRKVVAPNTLLEGANAEGKLDIREALIRGAISESGEVDAYRFTGKAGDFVSAEFNGFDVPIGDAVIGAIQLFFVEDDGSLTLVAQNFQNFEGFDALLVDAPLAKNGDYVMQVSSPNILSFDFTGDGIPDLFPLDETNNGDLRTGDYNLSIYKVTGKPGNGPSRVPG